jgi:hypothetical protein
MAANDNRPSLPRYQPDAIKANWAMVDALSDFGNPRGLTPVQVALARPARAEALDRSHPRHDQARPSPDTGTQAQQTNR